MEDNMEDKHMKDIKHWNDLHLKASRTSFLSNYIVSGLAIIFIVLLINRFGLGFDLFPDSKGEMVSTLIILGLVLIPTFLIEQPELIRFMRQYKITLNEVMKTEGIFTKKKIILPYQSVSEVTVHQSFFWQTSELWRFARRGIWSRERYTHDGHKKCTEDS
jgi:uncharacterized membrane protein YdbT with pleckstrin-like domain